MAIDYIKQADGTTSVAAAQKISVMYLDQLARTNPWLAHRAMPFQAEALKTGGGNYVFHSVIGVDVPTRRGAAPTDSTIVYDGVISNETVNLTVDQPFLTKAFPFENADMVQMDGINYSPIISDQITKSLVLAEIETDTAAVTLNADRRIIGGVAATTDLDKLKLIKDTIADYYDISDGNTNWTTDAYKYFAGQDGAYTAEQFKIHLHPSQIMKFSNAITEAGAGSNLEFQEFVTGAVPMIGGVEVISNRFISKDHSYISPMSMIGTPDPEVMATTINQWFDNGNNINAIRGWHYFDSVLVTPELVTDIDYTI